MSLPDSSPTRSVGRAPAPALPTTGYSKRYLIGLDGLRALAVVLVLIYHLLPGVLPAGMVGVDAFFVISGFLITSLLLTERHRSGHISLRRFWGRRLRRILPALLLTVVVVSALAVCLGGDVLLGIRRQIIGAALLVYNWVEIAAGSSYFDLTQPLLLTNVWSLAVEEQFYLFWPLILFFLLRRSCTRQRTRFCAGVALVLALVSIGAAFALLFLKTSFSRIYMGTDTHAFGLMLGAALALFHGQATGGIASRPAPVLMRTMRGLLGWLGLVGLVVCARFGVDGSLVGTAAFAPTAWMIAASVCTLCIVQAFTAEVAQYAGPGWLLARLLNLLPLRWLGLRSYGLYLWHWPLWVLAFYALPRNWDTRLVAILVTAVSLLVAQLSYRYLETPIRRQGFKQWLCNAKTLGPKQVLGISGAVSAICLLVGLAFTLQPHQSTAQQAISAGQRALAAAQASTKPAPDAASASPSAAAAATTASSPTPTPTPSSVSGAQVEIVGDSVTLASAPSLEAALPGVVVDGKVSRSFYAALPTLQSLDAQYGARPYVVVSLVTNGTVTTDQLDELLSYLGDRKLVLVTGYGPPRTTWIPDANATLVNYAAAHPQQVAIADWQSAIAPHPDLLAEDLVHPGPQGGDIYAATVTAALNSLL